MIKTLGVIPARFGSTRFEGKPLAEINGKTMIEWVYKRACKSNLDKVIVATDDSRIYEKVIDFGGEAIYTSKEHNTGTDRIAEVAEKLGDYNIIINIQGDEPLIEPEMINSLIEPFKNDKTLKMGTLKHKITNPDEIQNENIVKVATDLYDFALYFSRSAIPFLRTKGNIDYYRHIGIYGYEREFLLKYAKLQQTPLEKSESLEQLRALENGYKIKVINTPFNVKGVDTPKDLEDVVSFIKDKKIEI